MTLQNLSKILDKYDQQLRSGSTQASQFELLKGLPFYDWSLKPSLANRITTFNSAIGLPQKNGQFYPLFDYEGLVFETLQKHKQVWIKKATGLGITEFMLRYMAWLCLKDDRLRSSQMCIVTGPRIDMAVGLIARLKSLFLDNALSPGTITFDTKENVIILNGVHIEAYPSHHLDAMRGIPNVSFILLDEADFFPPGQQQDARDVSERYIAKSNPWIVMVSTPNAPEGLFEKIEREAESACLYKRLFLDYTYGIDKIYTKEEIALAQKSPSFEREYNLKYLGKVGNVFHTLDIEAAIVTQQQGQEMLNWSTSPMIGRSMGIDVAWGDTSKFAIVITQKRNNKVEVFYAESFDKPQMNQIINHVLQLKQRHHITRIYVDGANPEVIRELKRRIGEFENIQEYYTEEQIWRMRYGDNMQIVPVNFQKRHREMLQWCYTLMSKELIRIHPALQKLIVSLRTAIVIDDWKLDKQQTSFDDILDSFRLSLCNYEPPKNL